MSLSARYGDSGIQGRFKRRGQARYRVSAETRRISATLHAWAEAAAWFVRWISVEYFRHLARAAPLCESANRLEYSRRPLPRRITVESNIRGDERTQQPGPHGSLVIRGVAFFG